MSAGRVSCHDGRGDVLGYSGTGDAGGPPPHLPPKDQPGTDVRRASIERFSDQMTLKLRTDDRIPNRVNPRAKLYFSFVGSTRGTVHRSAAITSRLTGKVWTVEVRVSRWDTSGTMPDSSRTLRLTPKITGKVFELTLGVADLPRLMRGAFRWSSRSEWIPKPTRDAGEVYIDDCPELPAVPAFQETDG